MRFRLPSQHNPYLDRKFQNRMLRWMGVIVVVMFGAQLIRVTISNRKPNSSVPGANAPISPDAQKVVLEESWAAQPGDVQVVPPPANSPPRTPPRELDDPRIDPELLSHIKDNTIGLRRDEADHFYWLLAHADSVPQQELERSARKDVLYSNLMSEPDTYRGQLVTFTGEMRRLNRFTASPNDQDLKTLYEAWVITPDSNMSPVRVVAVGLADERMVPGQSLSAPVTITGYFFKRQGYEAVGGLRVTPLIVARRILWHRPPSVPPVDAGPLPYLVGGVVLIGLVFFGVLINLSIDDWRAQRQILEQARQLHQKGDVDFSRVEAPNVHDSLRQLEWEHRSPTRASSAKTTSTNENADRLEPGSPEVAKSQESDGRPWADATREAALKQRFPYRELTPEEYLARFGRSILNSHYDRFRYADGELDRWVRQVYQVLRSTPAMERAPHQYLATDELSQLPQWKPENENVGR